MQRAAGLVARGLGRSYNDVTRRRGSGRVITTFRLNRIEDFDAQRDDLSSRGEPGDSTVYSGLS
jgi:hypothetical protein